MAELPKLAVPASAKLLLPYQQRVIADPAKIVVLEKSRRIGGTEGFAFRAAYEGCFGPRGKVLDTWFSSADESAAREYMDRVAHWCRVFDKVVQVVTSRTLVDGRDLKVFEAELPAGCRVTAMASSPKRFRSKGGRVILDEFAFHESPRDMWQAAVPVTTWGGTITVLSTHNGDATYFHELCEMGRRLQRGESKPGDIKLSLHTITIHDAVREGLVERINAVRGTSMTRQQFLAECRESLSQEQWEEEFECRPSTQAGSYLPYELTRPRVSDTCPPPRDSVVDFLADIQEGAKDADALYAGVDIGRVEDRFVIWVLAQVGGMRHTVAMLVWQGMPFPAMDGAMRSLMQHRFRRRDERMIEVRRMAIDSSSIGMQLGEAMHAAYAHRVERIMITLGVKAEIYPGVRRALEEATVTLPADTVTLADLASVRREVTVAGNIRYAGERTKGGHADRACALALALHAADDKSGNARFVDLKGWI